MATQLDPSAILGQLTSSYMKLPLIQKIAFPLILIGSIMGIIYVSKWANQPSYVALFSDLEPSDSAAVIERLKSLKVNYEVRGDGSTIAISPPEMVHELRMSLAGEGIPKGGKVGLEIFEDTDLGTTTFQEKVKFMRAIQGELERTISSLDGVTTARVHIAQPEKSVFAARGDKTTASVLLQLRPGGELSPEQVRGIAHLVAGSVEGLSVSDVSILDAQGNLLTRQDEDQDTMLHLEATQLSYQREVEQGYVRRIEQMLSKVLGPGRAIARVTAEMDFSQQEREEESYDPGGQVLRSERSVQEGTGNSQRGGIPGVVSNLRNDPEILSTPEQDSNSRSEQVKNYEVSRAVSKVISPRGKLLKLSVAVVLDNSAPAEADSANEEGQAAPSEAPARVFDEQAMARIDSLVKSAVGYDPTRGDTVTVESMAFQKSGVDFSEILNAKATQDLIFDSIYRFGPILFLVLFFFVIVRPLVKFLVTPTEAEVDLERLLPTGIRELEQELQAERTRAASVPDFEPSVDLAQLEELMSENSRVVQENPHQAALLIRYWLNDGRI